MFSAPQRICKSDNGRIEAPTEIHDNRNAGLELGESLCFSIVRSNWFLKNYEPYIFFKYIFKHLRVSIIWCRNNDDVGSLGSKHLFDVRVCVGAPALRFRRCSFSDINESAQLERGVLRYPMRMRQEFVRTRTISAATDAAGPDDRRTIYVVCSLFIL